jgi:hypothetical protein
LSRDITYFVQQLLRERENSEESLECVQNASKEMLRTCAGYREGIQKADANLMMF